NAITMNLGAALCGEGDYERALAQFEIAYQMSEKLGASGTLALAAANRALCHGRLGQHVKQVEWAEKASHHLGKRYTGYRNIQIATNLGYGYALTGRSIEARRAVDYLDQRLPGTTPNWLEQVWLLNKADILTLSGDPAAAR